MLLKNSERDSGGGELEVHGGLEVADDGVTLVNMKTFEIIPTYTCGHCSDVVMMRQDRKRERTRCKRCMKLICEKKELCRLDCTPLHELAKDHFENSGQFGKFVPAIMAGCNTLNEAQNKGLILP